MESLEQRVLFSINPTGAEQEMLELINRMRANPTDELEHIFISTDSSDSNYFRTNDAGVNAALDFFNVDDTTLFSQIAALTEAPPLAWNGALIDSALAHNNLMIAQDTQAHILPGEDGLLDRMVDAGYNWSGSVSVAENVFAYTENVFHGHSAFVIDWGATPTGIQDPAGHRENIMDADLQEVGISIVAENNSSTTVGPFVVTQDFGVRGNYDPQLLGVIFDDADGDAFYDAGEGLGGVTISISNGSSVYTTTSMTAGGYQVDVPAGNYTVTATGGGLGSSVVFMGSVTMGSDNVKLDLDKDNVPTSGTVVGNVFADVDQDGTHDGSESGLGSFTVFVDTDSDGTLDAGEVSTTTNSSGAYSLGGLGSGTYDIVVSAKGGYIPTNSDTISASVTVGSTTTDVDFGQFQWLNKSGSVATINGTNGADTITFSVGTSGNATIGFNGLGQALDSSFTSVVIDGGTGDDSIVINNGSGDDSVTLRPGTVYMAGSSHTINGADLEDIRVNSGGGNDVAFLYDDVTSDSFTGRETYAYLTGANFYNFVSGFDSVKAFATAGGSDIAFLHDGAGNDTFVGRENYAYLSGSGFSNWAEGFDQVRGNATGGTDAAFLYDSAGNDSYTSRPEYAYLWGSGFYNLASGFDSVKGYATSGTDAAFMYDSSGDDIFSTRPEFGYMRADDYSFFNYAFDFDSVKGYGTNGGYDLAYFYDSSGDDVFTAHSSYALLRADDSSFFNYVYGFDKVNALGGAGGNDNAFLFDSAGDDVFTTTSTYALMRDSSFSFFNYVRNFTNVYGYSQNGGSDAAFLNDSSGNDTLTARVGYATLSNSSSLVRANGFGTVNAYGNNGGTNSDDVAGTLDYVLQQFGDWS